MVINISGVANAQSIASAPKEAAATGKAKPYPWIINPVFDFVFVTGGGVLCLMLFNYFFIGWTVPTEFNTPTNIFLITTMFLSQHMFADSHNTATYMRIWGSQEDQQRFKFYRTWLVYACIPVFVLGLAKPEFTSGIVYLYLITVFWHYAVQAFGIALIYCYKRNYIMNNTEKEIFRWFILSMAGFVIIRFLTDQDFSPRNFYGVAIPFWGPLPIGLLNASRFIFICLSIAFGFVLVRKFIMEKKLMPVPSLLLILTVAALGLSKGTQNAMMWFYVPGFYHGSQYLAVCLSYFIKERGMPEGMSTWDVGKVAASGVGLKYIGTVILTGCFFYIGIPHFFMQLGFDYALIGGLVLGTVNFHHFITDAAIWRLRDKRCRNLLLA